MPKSSISNYKKEPYKVSRWSTCNRLRIDEYYLRIDKLRLVSVFEGAEWSALTLKVTVSAYQYSN